MPADENKGSTHQSEDESPGRLWRSVKNLLGLRISEPTLREQLEEAILEHENVEEESENAERNGDLSTVERTMLRNLLHFSEHRVDDVMVPRSEIIAINETDTLDDTVRLFAEHGHSRIPVYRENLDNVIGMIHIKDIFAMLADPQNRKNDNWTQHIRMPRFAPESMGVLDLLAEMRATRTHLAIILDEYSGTEGLVTIEDLVEEIVGDIEDEHDDEPVELIQQISENIWEVDARVELDDLADIIDPALGEVEEDVDTIGGLAFVLAGQIPTAGQIYTHEPSNVEIKILDGDQKRVTRILLTKMDNEKDII
ncbi:magnesium/cobalt efflux protein [Sphingorhabdus lutea]|uniref:Magnesium/cobalt efflux protein n=1 Tax=Sphingorhabdus lutea TaxID=1913578 RepID=A0A1L3JD83_9SPHN|nr:hemolysin family protein [Sphingorhabdus lutea]APG63049.1 magnesium/cobalt efflux protein [Sphingorhabdus lutea]